MSIARNNDDTLRSQVIIIIMFEMYTSLLVWFFECSTDFPIVKRFISDPYLRWTFLQVAAQSIKCLHSDYGRLYPYMIFVEDFFFLRQMEVFPIYRRSTGLVMWHDIHHSFFLDISNGDYTLCTPILDGITESAESSHWPSSGLIC